MMYLETERSSQVAEVEEWKGKGMEWSQLVSKWLPIFSEIKSAGYADTSAPTMRHAAEAFVSDAARDSAYAAQLRHDMVGAIKGALALFCFSELIAYLTITSFSALVTNGKMRGGGAYYMISRSLGAGLLTLYVGYLVVVTHDGFTRPARPPA